MSEDRAATRRLQALYDFVARSANVRPQSVLDAAGARALTALEEAGVGALLVKGPLLAQRLYRPGEHRSYLDIDILVDPRRLDRARAVLEELGYNRTGTEEAGVDDFLGVLDAEAWGADDGCGIDLHWRLAGWSADPVAVWDVVHPGRDVIELAGRRVSAFGSDALTVHVATHAAQSGPSDVKALGDLTRAIERWPLARWQAAARLAEAVDATGALGAGLRLLPTGEEIAAKLGLPASERLDWAIRNRAVRPRGTFHVRGLVEAGGWPERLRILRGSLLPNRAWITAQMPWARRNAPSLVAAYALHLVRAPLWAIRAWRFERRARRSG